MPSGPGGRSLDASGLDAPVVVFNPASTVRGGIVEIEGELLPVEVVPAGGAILADAARLHAVEPVEVEGLAMRNGRIEVEFDDVGRVRMLRRVGGDDVVETPINRFRLYEDRPRRWEAWDVDRDYHEKFEEITAPAARHGVIESGPMRGAIEFEHVIGNASRLVVRYVLDSESDRLDVRLLVDWREERRLLRAEFPTTIRARAATFGIQFGEIERATHRNTSWEEARFEVPGRRWMDLAQPGLGLAVLDAGIIGRNVRSGVMGLSLLRAPMFPDPGCDRGEHRLRYALMPHDGDRRSAGRAGVDAEAESFAEPLVARRLEGEEAGPVGDSVRKAFQIEIDGAASLEVAALKPAEDGDGVVLRLVEKHGASGRVRITVPEWSRVDAVDLRERLVEHPGLVFDETERVVHLRLRPFGIESIRLRR